MTKEEVEFLVDGLTLRGSLYVPENKAKNMAVLFLHGWTGAPNEPAAKIVAEKGYITMTFSLSGHNNSDGIFEEQTREKSLREVIAAYDYLKTKISGDMKVAVCGNSYGGYMAALLSAEREVAAIQLRVPANYQDKKSDQPQYKLSGWDKRVVKWRHQSLPPNATKSLRAMHAFRGPVQILEASEDELIPHQTILNYIGAIPDESNIDYHFMEGWPHSLGDDPARNRQYQEMLLNWLERL